MEERSLRACEQVGLRCTNKLATISSSAPFDTPVDINTWLWPWYIYRQLHISYTNHTFFFIFPPLKVIRVDFSQLQNFIVVILCNFAVFDISCAKIGDLHVRCLGLTDLELLLHLPSALGWSTHLSSGFTVIVGSRSLWKTLFPYLMSDSDLSKWFSHS